MFAPKISANRCPICILQQGEKPASDKLLLCNNCKLISYCSGAHQKLDWPIHKPFCNTVYKIMKTRNIKHPLELNGRIDGMAMYLQTLLNLKCLIQITLQRRLEQQEEELTTFPKVCAICFSHNVKHMLRCTKCDTASYCSVEHKTKDLARHEALCADLKLSYMGYFANDEHTSPIKFNFTKSIKVSNHGNVLEVLQSKSNVKFQQPDSIHQFRKFATASQFSSVITILAMIERLKIDIENNTLVLYIVGATNDHIYFEDDHLRCILSELMNVQTLRIFFIGPELQARQAGAKSISCRGLQRDIEKVFFNVAFEDFVDIIGKDISPKNRPTLILSFNCGFAECNDDVGGKENPWLKGLSPMLQFFHVPIVFTSYTKVESTFDMAMVVKTAAMLSHTALVYDTLIRAEKNPFRDCMPLRNWEITDTDDPIYYRNGYIQAILTRRDP